MSTQRLSPLSSAQAAELAECTCFNIRKSARAETQYFDQSMAASGLRVTQFSILAVVQIAGPLTMQALAEAMVMDRTTLTRNLRPLEEAGLIHIQPGADRRTRELTLTEAGQSALLEAIPLWKSAQEHMIARLGRGRWAGFLDNLSSAIEAARAQ